MDVVAHWLLAAGEALLKAVLNPFSCLAWLILALLCRRRTELERKLFAVRLHSMPGEWLRAFGAGLAAALAVSLAVVLSGLQLTPDAVYWTWAVVLLLLPFRLRFANLPAAAAIVGALRLAVEPVRDFVPDAVRPLASSLLAIDPPSLWMLAALTLLAQAVLVGVSAGRGAVPLYVRGKRGKPIGAYQLHALWLMPMVLAVPAGSGSNGAAGAEPPWWLAWLLAQPDAGAAGNAGLVPWLPWPMVFGDGAWTDGIALLAFPVMAGFVDMSVSELPLRRAKRLALRYAVWGLAIGAFAAAAHFWPVLLPAAAAVALLLPEVWQQLADRAERRRSPEFVRRGRGLKVLDVLVPSPAAEMGIRRGETVVRANGMRVNTPDKLHAALRSNPAFSRLEVIGTDGENRFVQRPLYSGEHHLLGLVLCPDSRVLHTIRWRPLTLWQLLRIRTHNHQPPAESEWAEPLDDYAFASGAGAARAADSAGLAVAEAAAGPAGGSASRDTASEGTDGTTASEVAAGTESVSDATASASAADSGGRSVSTELTIPEPSAGSDKSSSPGNVPNGDVSSTRIAPASEDKYKHGAAPNEAATAKEE